MPFYRFRLLSPRAQLLCTLMQGTYLAQRWQAKRLLKLYYICDGGRGFFTEIGIDETQEQFVVVRSFKSSVPLGDYAQEVGLLGE